VKFGDPPIEWIPVTGSALPSHLRIQALSILKVIVDMPTVWLSVKDDRKDEICSYCALLLKMFHSLPRIEMSYCGWKL
jgi:hypothetical protein